MVVALIVLIASIVDVYVHRKSSGAQSDAEIETNNNNDDAKDVKGSKETVLKGDDECTRKRTGKRIT